jgi:hypothetical protein
MSEHVYFITLALPAATILIVFGMRYYAAVQQARARLANDDAYRQTAEKAAAAETATAGALAAIQASMADAAARLAAIETVLKAVE